LPFIKPSFPWGVPIPFWTKKASRLHITMKIEENSQYHVGDVKVTSSKAFTIPQMFDKSAGSQAGDVYNETALRNSFDQLRRRTDRSAYQLHSDTAAAI
jgi:outer membrane protein assembly factor BamA